MVTSARRRRAVARASVLILVAALALLAVASPAAAAPSEPTMSLTELQARLDSGPLSGYLKTTVQGYTIVEVPVTVEGTVDWSYGTLILAEASGPVIDKAGAIAAGMSGSPVYVDDGGVDKLVGALSYGSEFTIGGMFLATPVEYMAAIEAGYAVRPPDTMTLRPPAPIDTSAGPVRSVVVTRSQKAAGEVEVKAGQVVMSPMAVLEIGGLAPDSRAFKELAARLEAKTGLTARAASSAGFWAGADAPPLQAGSSVCELFSLGSVWYGASGTVTYVSDGVAMCFGHSVWWTGDSGAAMVAGFVSGIWPNDWDPFVMTSPRDIKGTMVQDRTWGVAGVVDVDPDMIPITTRVTFPETGRDVAGESGAVQWAFRTPGYEELPAFPVMYALWRACDVGMMPGSADTVTTVKVHDESGRYTVTLANVWDSWDITWDPFYDADNAVYTLAQDPLGVLDVHLDSIDFQATISTQRRSAWPVALELPGGELRTGDNEIRVTYYGYGSAVKKSVSATLTIPDDTPVNGDIVVMPGGYYWGGDEGVDGLEEADDSSPLTLADLVDGLNGQSKNSDLLLTFYPRAADGGGVPVGSREGAEAAGGDPYGGGSNLEPITVTVPTAWVFQDGLQASTVQVALGAEPGRVDRGEPVMLSGTVQGLGAGIPVGIYRIDVATGTEALVDTVSTTVQDGMATFEAVAAPAVHDTAFVARVGGIDGWLPGSASATVEVRAMVRLTASVSGRRVALTAKVLPADAGGKVAFQRYTGGRWRTRATVAVSPAGTAAWTWRAPGAGTYRWRARSFGSDVNAPGVSRTARTLVP